MHCQIVVMSNKSNLDKITSEDRPQQSRPHLRLGGDSICNTQSRTGHL
jgi:hypothetical protein